jgi:hypothetical protein
MDQRARSAAGRVRLVADLAMPAAALPPGNRKRAWPPCCWIC